MFANPLNKLVAAYATLLAALGVFAFVKDGSTMSLAGVAVALVLFGLLALHSSQPRLSRILTAVITLAMAGQFLPKAIKSLSVPPTNTQGEPSASWHFWVISIASILMFIALGMGHMAASKANRIRSEG